MPSSSFIVNSEFQPMSYQELLHPVITQTQYQRELDEKYTQLDLQADKLEQLANSAVDAESYAKYKNFANKLREEASNLSKYGLRGRDSARFMELFRNYGKEIQPLLNAQAKRERLIEQQRQLSMQDPTSLYDRSAGNISLQELMANPSAAPIRLSGDLLMKLSAAIALNLAKEIREAVFTKTNTPGYLAFKQKYGLSSSEIAAFASDPNSPNANRVLKAIYDLVMTSSGVKENWEGDAYNKASQYVAMGLWNAIGAQQVQPLTDVYGMEQLRAANEMARLRASIAGLERLEKLRYNNKMSLLKEAGALKLKKGTEDKELNVVPVANMDKKERTEFDDKAKHFRNLGLLTKNGGITDRGMNVLKTLIENINNLRNWTKARGLKLDKNGTWTDKNGKVVRPPFGLWDKNSQYKWLTPKALDTGSNVQAAVNVENRMREFVHFVEKNALNGRPIDSLTITQKRISGDNDWNYKVGWGIKDNKTGKNIDVRNLYKNLVSMTKEGVDLNRTTAFDVKIGSTKGKEYAQSMAKGKDEIEIIDSKGKRKTIDVEDLYGDNFETQGIISVNPDKKQFYINAHIDGKAVKIPVSRDVIGNSTYQNVMDMASRLSKAGNWIKDDKKPNFDSNGLIDFNSEPSTKWNYSDPNDVLGIYQFKQDYKQNMLDFGRYVVGTASGAEAKDTPVNYTDPADDGDEYIYNLIFGDE